MEEKLDEDCGCGGTTDSIRNFTSASTTASRYNQDPLVGTRVNLVDGRTGKVDDSIRNNTGEVIGYVIEGDRGTYRVFKNKISGPIEEGEGAMASLSATPGMGNVIPPGPGRTGSGDQFPSLSVGTPAAKKKKKKKDPNPTDTSLMDFKTFLNKTKGNQ
jgi:hypothetical protein